MEEHESILVSVILARGQSLSGAVEAAVNAASNSLLQAESLRAECVSPARAAEYDEPLLEAAKKAADILRLQDHARTALIRAKGARSITEARSIVEEIAADAEKAQELRLDIHTLLEDV